MFWAKLATKYNSIFINEPLRVYYIEESNKNNMSSATREQSADKIFTMKKVWINNFLNYLTHEPLLILRLLFSTSFYGLLSEKSSKEIINASPSLWKKVILLISIIPAKILIRKLKLGK